MRTPVDSVREDDSILVAARTMRERDVGFLPVCDREGRAIGILTDRDIAIRVAAEDLGAGATSVRHAMTSSVVGCQPDDTVTSVERRMQEHRITRVVVLDPDGRPVGIVSLSDLAPYESSAKLANTVRAVAERKYQPERP